MLILAPRLDVNGERWFTPKEKGKDIPGLRLKVASIENDKYRSRNALIRRHIERLDSTYGAGTETFDLSVVGDIDSMDDLLIQNCAQFLLVGWEGVGEVVDGEQQAVEYSVEKGFLLLKQKPELYWQVLGLAAEIAQGKAEQKKDAVAK